MEVSTTEDVTQAGTRLDAEGLDTAQFSSAAPDSWHGSQALARGFLTCVIDLFEQ
jgi:hypothetical protein